MTTRLITPPAALAVSLDDAKLTLRIEQDDNSLDAQITLTLKGITSQCEHELGRALVHQQWRVSVDGVTDAIRLERPPIVSVDSIKFYDVDGLLQTLDPVDYYADIVSEPGYVVPATGRAWPSLASRPHAITVDYTCGYGPDHTTVPADVQLYILARLQEQWDADAREFKETVRSSYLGRLLDSCRVYC